MLNFNDSDLIKLGIENAKSDKTKPTTEQIKFYNSLYNKDDLSNYIVVNKKPRKIKGRIGDDDNSKYKN